MHLTILDTDAKSFFQQASDLEKSFPVGCWRYVKFADANKVTALFETEQETQNSISLNKNFFKYFLGTFSPSLEKNIDIHQLEDFKNFCIKLNTLLDQKNDVFDLSVSKKWIWSQGNSVQVSDKLFSFLEFN